MHVHARYLILLLSKKQKQNSFLCISRTASTAVLWPATTPMRRGPQLTILLYHRTSTESRTPQIPSIPPGPSQENHAAAGCNNFLYQRYTFMHVIHIKQIKSAVHCRYGNALGRQHKDAAAALTVVVRAQTKSSGSMWLKRCTVQYPKTVPQKLSRQTSLFTQALRLLSRRTLSTIG